MKKIFASIGIVSVLVVLGIVYANNIFDVRSISLKSTDTGSSETQRRVTADEFNAIVKTLQGIENISPSGAGGYSVGLGVAAVNGVDLVARGVGVKFSGGDSKTKTECDDNLRGKLFYDSKNHHFWGCNGKKLVQLDVGDCPIDGVWGATHYNCDKGIVANKRDTKSSYN